MTELKKFYKEHHICVACGQENAVPGQTLCYYCRGNNRDNGRKYYHEHREELNAKNKERNKSVYAERAEKGLCTRCGKREPLSGRKKCGRCLAKDREAHIKGAREKGVIPKYLLGNGTYCYTCSKEVEVKGEKLCNKCKANSQRTIAEARKHITKTGFWYKPFIFDKREKQEENNG